MAKKNPMSFKFENLQVWQEALDLSAQVHSLTRNFPKEEMFILTSQIKRAADSVALNIAEGSTGQTNAEFRLFLGYAIRSGIEVIACLYVGRKRSLINEVQFNSLYQSGENLIRRLQALRKSIK